MVIILTNIILTNLICKHYGCVYHRLALMYVSMSCIPKLMARLELNFPLCLLMIVFEISMMLAISLDDEDDEWSSGCF
jgi:Rieske Fe-S protein